MVVITMETALFLTRWQNAPRQRTRVQVSASSDQEKLSCHSPSSSQIKSCGSRLNAFICLSHSHVPRASVDGFISFGFVHEHGLEFSSSTCFFLNFSVGSQQMRGMRKQGGSFAALQVLSSISEIAQRPTHSWPLLCVLVWGVTSVYTTNSSLAANSAYSI